MFDTCYSQQVAGEALLVVRSLKETSEDNADWEQVEKMLVSGQVPSRSPGSGAVSRAEQSEDAALASYGEADDAREESLVRYDDDRLGRAVLYIHQNVEKSICVQDVFRETCVSRRWLEYAFRAAFGISPYQYLRSVRLELARHRLIAHPKSTINQIALGTGFSSVRQFSMSFRQQFGYSPTDCRKQRCCVA